jgi:sarcosine oxidase
VTADRSDEKGVPELDAEVIVVGLGIHGAAAAYELARRGISVIGLERFPTGHTRGSSHGATRMIRRAYPSPVWNPLVTRAFDGWQRWGEAAGRSFVHTTGGVYAHAHPGSLQGAGVVALERDDLARVAPSLDVPEGFWAVHDPDAGVIEAEDALTFARDEARRLGADLRYGVTYRDWTLEGDTVVVDTEAGSLRASRIVLAVGAWAAEAVPELADVFEVWRIVTVTAKPGQAVASPPLLGSFSVDLPEGLVFGLPEVGGYGIKVGVDAGLVWDPSVPPAAPTADEVDHLRGLLEGFVPGVATEDLDAVSCLYTMTPDKRFVVGPLPWSPRVLLVASCSGHGFKFGPAMGEAVADLVQDKPRPDLDFLAADRFSPIEARQNA